MKNSKPYRDSIKGGTFIAREIYLSPAWASLSKNGLKAFMAFYDARIFPKNKKGRKGDKRANQEPLNSDDLGVTHGNFERFGIPRGKVSAAIREVAAKGFIELRHRGGGSRGDRSIYALSKKWRDWKPGSEPCQVWEKREKHGYQGRGLGAVAKWKKPKQGDQEQSTGEVLVHNPEVVKFGEAKELEAEVRDIIKKHPKTRRAKRVWADTIIFYLKGQFQKANTYPLKDGGPLQVSLESIYKRFLSFPDENIDYIQLLYPHEPKRKKHCTQNVEVT
jgi:hypothetical protein